MAMFFVGQRVRILVSSTGKEGLEGRIWHTGISIRERTGEEFFAYFVDIDGFGRFDGCGRRWAYKGHELQPILPDGMQPVAWSECLWQPEGVAA